jgi:hypothetical protein
VENLQATMKSSINLIVDVIFVIFVASIFYGDIYIGITVPIAIPFLALLGLVLSFRSGLAPAVPVPPIWFLLAFVILVPTLGVMAGTPPNRFDVGSYLPIIYAAAAFQIMAFLPVSNKAIIHGLFSGVFVLGVLLTCSILLDEPGRELIPGQSLERTEARFQKSIEEETKAAITARMDQRAIERHAGMQSSDENTHPNARTGKPTAFAVAPVDDEPTRRFYRYKQTIVTPLGSSNYLSVFCLFVFTVAVFIRRYMVALVCVALIGLTMSRFGLILMVVPIAVLTVEKIQERNRKRNRTKLITCATMASVSAAIALFYLMALHDLGSQSLAARGAIATSSFPVIIEHPLLGLPRSWIVMTWNYSANWNPHNLLLWLLSFSGILGTFLYLSYLIFLVRGLCYLRRERLWFGLLVATVTLLIFSMVEIVFLTPAVDLLVATIGGLAFQRAAVEQSLRRQAHLAVKGSQRAA